MIWSIPIVRVSGVWVKIHVSFLLFVGWLLWSTPKIVPEVLLIFACIVLHEFGHVFAARYFGIGTVDVTMLPIGCLARLERGPDQPRQELVIAIAGPLVNLLIALALFSVLVLRGLPSDHSPPTLHLNLMVANIALFIFNLVPAFPMDGGRILRALLCLMKFEPHYATKVAARLGQGFAICFCVIGVWKSPLLIFVGLTIFLAASRESST